MKKIIPLLLSVMMLVLISGCANNTLEDQIKGKTFIYEKDGAGGEFYITLNKDKTFDCYEGSLSSLYVENVGTWELNGKTLTLTHNINYEQQKKRVNNFSVENETLVYQEKDSNNFPYVKVLDGDKFIAKN